MLGASFTVHRQPSTICCPPWGFFAHRKINRQAVFTLPPEMLVFYKKHIDFLTEQSVAPDIRRYSSPFEHSRHYIDLDRYGKPPFDSILPRNWTDALLRHTDFFFVNEKNDTLSLLSRDSSGNFATAGDSLLFNPAVFPKKPSSELERPAKMTQKEFRRFYQRQFLSLYYEDNQTVSSDSLAVLLGVKRLRCEQIFQKEHLTQHGILPWHLVRMQERLTEAFREGDAEKILKLSADFGHYIGDAHVPLHTTQNYNGQLTGQDGIHAFWESRIPELFAEEDYDFWTGRAELFESPQEFFWNIVLKSHTLVDSVLFIEQSLRQNFPSDRQLCYDIRGERTVQTQCEEFAAAYQKRMGGMVEERMRSSIQATGAAWYTAWVLAGQPDLSKLGEAKPDEKEEEELKKAFRLGRIFGRAHDE